MFEQNNSILRNYSCVYCPVFDTKVTITTVKFKNIKYLVDLIIIARIFEKINNNTNILILCV